MERFFINKEITGNSLLIEDYKVIHKLISVLRLKRGDQIKIFDTNGKEFLAELTEISKKSVGLGINKELENKSEPDVKLHLYPSLFRKNKFEWMLEKCTEVGVYSFNPIISKRSVIEIKQIPERWSKIIIEAAQQSGRVHVPNINNPLSLREAMEQAKGEIVIAAEKNFLDTKNIVNFFDSTGYKSLSQFKEISLFIGPEGGWDTEEAELLNSRQAKFLSFGERILRAETAAIVCSAFCVYK